MQSVLKVQCRVLLCSNWKDVLQVSIYTPLGNIGMPACLTITPHIAPACVQSEFRSLNILYKASVSQPWASSLCLSPANLISLNLLKCFPLAVTTTIGGPNWHMHIHLLMSWGLSFDLRVMLTTALLREFHPPQTIAYQLTNWPLTTAHVKWITEHVF